MTLKISFYLWMHTRVEVSISESHLDVSSREEDTPGEPRVAHRYLLDLDGLILIHQQQQQEERERVRK